MPGRCLWTCWQEVRVAGGLLLGSRACGMQQRSGRQEAASGRLGRGVLQAFHAQQRPQHTLGRHLRTQILVGSSAEAARGRSSLWFRTSGEDPPQQVPAW